jgi:hypothetical protein
LRREFCEFLSVAKSLGPHCSIYIQSCSMVSGEWMAMCVRARKRHFRP